MRTEAIPILTVAVKPAVLFASSRDLGTATGRMRAWMDGWREGRREGRRMERGEI